MALRGLVLPVFIPSACSLFLSSFFIFGSTHTPFLGSWCFNTDDVRVSGTRWILERTEERPERCFTLKTTKTINKKSYSTLPRPEKGGTRFGKKT